MPSFSSSLVPRPRLVHEVRDAVQLVVEKAAWTSSLIEDEAWPNIR
jgi:hypothetical protein